MAKKGTTDGNADRRTDQHPADFAVVAEAEARLRGVPGTGLTSASRLGEGKSGVLKSFEPIDGRGDAVHTQADELGGGAQRGRG